ncbi:MAG TPA: hypothetical protein VK215_08895 [Acidimicrobiales bacterium]|nr:hypothetical protein [Acidimicrobiales bacterium]
MTAERICAADGCDNTVIRHGRPGRPAIYCSPDCRPSRIAGPGHPVVTVEVAQDDEHDDDGSDAGRNWVVRLQRGHDIVTIGRDLGRFSAMALAGDLCRLFGPTHREEAPSSRT